MAPNTDAAKLDEEGPAERDKVLQVLYGLSSFLAAFQIFFGVVRFPVELSLAVKAHALGDVERVIGGTLTKIGVGTASGGLVPTRALVTKYFGEMFVFVTHIVPALAWSAIVPFQLHPSSRSPALKKLHRTLGSIFFSLSATMMVGLAAIKRKDLGIRPGAEWFKGAQGKTIREMPKLLSAMIQANTPFMLGSAAWFTYTMYRSLSAAWRKRFADHEDWAMRHIASGQWVSLMRILFSGSLPLVFSRYGDTQEVLTSAFIGSAVAAWIACVSAAELAIVRVRANRARTKAVRTAKRKNAEEVLMLSDRKDVGA